MKPAAADDGLIIMKPLLAILCTILFCSCADMYVTKTDVPGSSSTVATTDSKDYGSKGIYMTTDCGVGAYGPKAIYIRPFASITGKGGFTATSAPKAKPIPRRSLPAIADD